MNVSTAQTGFTPPTQARSRRTLERILSAGADVLRTRGAEGFSIAEVCQRAQVSSGALYSRFDGKDSLLLAIHSHTLEQINREVIEMYQPGPRWDGLSPEATIDLAVHLLVEHYMEHADILGVFVLMTATDRRLRLNTQEAAEKMVSSFRDRLLVHADAFPHPDPSTAIDAVFALSFESLAHHVAFGREFWNHDAHPMAETAHILPRLARLHLLTPPDNAS